MAKNKVVYYWLISVCVCIAAMLVLGGLTRLTDSGLSIMKWEPLSGAIPPLSESSWLGYFNEYRKIGEYRLQNNGMTLEEFKGIFWLEYFHRLMGRITGLIFFLPMAYFLWKKRLKQQTIVNVMIISGVAAFQGFAGWYMVSSGFSEQTDVSQYRLAIHLCLAFVLYGMIYWTALDSWYRTEDKPDTAAYGYLKILSAKLTLVVFFMVFLGALMAGTDAGFTYNTFPLMDGKLIPDGLYMMKPWYLNHFENITMIQFQHRLCAILLFIFTVGLIFYIPKRRADLKKLVLLFSFFLIIQVSLGILTLYGFKNFEAYTEQFAYKRVTMTPIIIAAAHQLNALFLFTISLRIWHKIKAETYHRLDIVT